MNWVETRFHRDLRKRIEELLEEKARNLVNGCARTFDEYQKQVGIIAGLQAALDLGQEVERAINNPEHKGDL